MSDIVRKKIAEGVYFNNIKDNRFKTVKISATMFVPLKRETASKNALLPMVLARSCKEYPNAASLNRELNNLYGATVSGYARKIGEAQALTISVSGLDDRYTMNSEKISQKLVHLLCSMIFHPKVENNEFASEDFNQEKRQLIESIEAEYNEKRIYAINRCTELMFENEAFGIRRFGTKESVEACTSKDVYGAWEDALKNSRVELMMLGSSDSKDAEKAFEAEFSKLKRNICSIETQLVKTVDEIKYKTDETDIAQSKMVLGFRTGVAEPQNTMAMRLAVAVLGGTPSSKLFMNVREKLSLCYYCAARYDRQKGIMFIDCGIEKANIEKTKEEILNQLNILKNGDITDFEIDSAKMSMANSFKTMADTLSGSEGWYITQMLDKELMSPKQAVEKLNAVTKEDIIDAAKTIELDTVYILTSKGKEEQ